MRFIGEPDGVTMKYYLGVTDYELKQMLPALDVALRHAEKKAAYYDDLVAGGEATDRQTTAQMKWQDAFQTLALFVHYAQEYIK